ncbi:hypothetical protein ABZV34_34460 [Streptomyces sp. NPDC005195]|uniref:hypothetical protein n=1 Tax=Streptomyces sp. NPDC005195 TaxID=3154561 RepID=UPI0033B53769
MYPTIGRHSGPTAKRSSSTCLPQPVRVAAAEALEVIEQSQDVKRAQAAVWTVNEAVRACRPGFISLHDDQDS